LASEQHHFGFITLYTIRSRHVNPNNYAADDRSLGILKPSCSSCTSCVRGRHGISGLYARGSSHYSKPILDASWACLRLSRNTFLRLPDMHSINCATYDLSDSIPDLVLLDINMSVMDGYEVCARMKSADRLAHVPVIFLSARTEIEDKVKVLTVGGVDYITKPFQTEEVLARVEAHLKIRRLQGELTKLNEELEERVRPRAAQLVELSTDKFIGDAVMSLFPRSAEDAVRGALETVREVNAFSEHLKENGKPTLRTGTGLQTGTVMLGIIGAEDRFQATILQDDGSPSRDRFQATVISDAVNTASRLESLTKLYGVDILASEDVINGLTNSGSCLHRFLRIAKVKGKEQPIRIHEIFEMDGKEEANKKIETMGAFEEGLDLYYRQQFAEAAVKFDSVSRANPEDIAYKLYLKRAAHFLCNRAPPEWTGIEG